MRLLSGKKYKNGFVFYIIILFKGAPWRAPLAVYRLEELCYNVCCRLTDKTDDFWRE